MGPDVVVAEGTDDVARIAADRVGQALVRRLTSRVAVATGRSPLGLYSELAARRRAGAFDVTGIRPYQLDEYLGLETEDRRSLFGWMRRGFLEPLAIEEERVVRVPTDGDLERSCAAFDAELDAVGGLDLAILGLGSNGHLGFNEPPSAPDAPTRAVELSRETIAANAGYWGSTDDVPERAVTMGLRQLLGARAIVLVVTGEPKREIVHRVLEGPVDPSVPATALREAPGAVSIVVDREAWGSP